MIAKDIKEKIQNYYNNDYVRYDHLIEHLMNNKIDRNEKLDVSHSGFDKSNDGNIAIFYYSDNTNLVVTIQGLLATQTI